MNLTSAFSFLVHPAKRENNQPEIGGTELDLNGDLAFMLSTAFIQSQTECSIDVAFQMDENGNQNNEIRNLVLDIIKNPTVKSTLPLAKILQSVTTHRSGLGLFFVLLGQDDAGEFKRIYLARFPADNGIIAEENDDQLHVEFINQVFMKSAVSYKAVVYEGSSLDADFWEGRAIDKQVSNNSVAISGYWIKDFLKSDFKTTPEVGTRRFAIALNETIRSCSDLEVKEELTAAATLAKNLNDQIVSIENFGERFRLSERSQNAMKTALAKPSLAFTQFRFSLAEFQQHVKFRRLQLSNGASLSAPAEDFDECFERSELDNNSGVQLTTRGRVVDESLSKVR